MPFKDYLIQNWALILVLIAFIISLLTTVFLDRKTVLRMYILIVMTFMLSICVFIEFYLNVLGSNVEARLILMAIRYSATPFIMALVMYTLTKKLHWAIFVPAIILSVLNIVSIFTGLVFGIGSDDRLQRGPLGYLPFIVAGLYCILLIFLLIRRSNKRLMEIIPIVFLSLTLASGLIFPFIFGPSYANIFCTTIGIALFTYYEFSILQLTKKDSLTGLLNRQAYFADINNNPDSISSIVYIDMNGLKTINDAGGHLAGDEALTTLALCFMRALKRRQSGYRIGGDEFVIVCRRNSQEDLNLLVERIRKYVSETDYSCSIGYSYSADGLKSVDDMLKESDVMMYKEKERYYEESSRNRRQR